MAGIDDNVAIIGDWVPPSPSPRAFFSAILGDDISSRTMSEHPQEHRTEGLFLGSQEQMTAGNANKKDVPLSGGAQFNQLDSLSEQKSSSRGGLVERMAARAGFNAPRLNTERIKSTDPSLNPEIRSPYLTIPPGLSPTTLLDSPVFVSNSLKLELSLCVSKVSESFDPDQGQNYGMDPNQMVEHKRTSILNILKQSNSVLPHAQPSPTTGKFSFLPGGNSKISALVSEPSDKRKDNFFDDINTSSFAFKPVAESGSSFFLGAASKVTPATVLQPSFPSIQVSVHSENSLPSDVVEQAKLQSQNRVSLNFPAELPRTTEKDNGHNSTTIDRGVFTTVGGSLGHSPPIDEQQDEEGDQRASGDSMTAGGGAGTPSEDGYNWRKYGQKQVKGSEYPRSYYKCTHPNCPVKKKVERSHEGHITEIIYKGAHNHPKPPPSRRSAIGSSSPLLEMQLDVPDQGVPQNGAENDPLWTSTHKGMASGPDWRHDSVEVTSSASADPEFGNPSSLVQAQNGTLLESADAVDASSTFSNDEDEDDRGTHGSVGYDGEGDESESKRRKIESYATEMSGATRAIREPRVVVQTTSEVDILDDGYRWRKYGQKVVKGNPNPRSYYKCTNAGCNVRKHVERASHDLKSVITTYEGKHNHDVPAARNSSHVNSSASNAMPAQVATAVQNHVQRPEPSQIHSSMTRFERSTPFGSFSLPGRQQLGSAPSFSFPMNQAAGLANMATAGLGPGQAKMPVLPIQPYMSHQRPMNEMGFVLPKGEPKMEPMSETSLNLAQNQSMYRQIMSRLPLGPHM